MKLYRYIDDSGWNDEPYLEEYEVIGTTPCGHWIDIIFPSRTRWVNKQTKKQFAYMTKELALDGYIRRKEKQILILNVKIGEAKNNLELAKKIDLSIKMSPTSLPLDYFMRSSI